LRPARVDVKRRTARAAAQELVEPPLEGKEILPHMQAKS